MRSAAKFEVRLSNGKLAKTTRSAASAYKDASTRIGARVYKIENGKRIVWPSITHARKRPLRRAHRRVNPSGRYFITATKKGVAYFYAGGARFTTHVRDAIRFPSVVHATRVKDEILRDFPSSLLKGTLLGVRLET